MKHQVPAAPRSCFGDATALSSTLKASRFDAVASPHRIPGRFFAADVAVLDTGFIDRCILVTLWVSGLFAVCIGLGSPLQGLSLAFGAAMAIGLLRSQQRHVQRLLGRDRTSAAGGEVNFRLPNWVPATLKYGVVGALLYLGIRTKTLVPEAFAAGFTILQIVIFARAVGRLVFSNNPSGDRSFKRNEKYI